MEWSLLPANVGIVSVISRDYYTNEIEITKIHELMALIVLNMWELAI